MRGGRPTLAGLFAAAGLLALPCPAHAHGLVQRADLPIPEWLFGLAAGVVLLVSFVALATLWRRPRYEGPTGGDGWRPVGRTVGRALAGGWTDLVAQALGLALLALVVVSGLAGTDSPTANLAPTFVFVVFWVGLVVASVLLGDVFHALNPWRALGRLLRLRGRRPYPDRLGHRPAAAGILAFTWLELVARDGESPETVAIATLVYTALTLVGMAVYGTEPWLRRGEAFSVLFGLLARIAPLEARDGHLGVRRPLSGLARFEAGPGTVGLLGVLIGTVTYDGLSSGEAWREVTRGLDTVWEAVGLDVETGLQASATVGLLGCSLLATILYRLGIEGARRASGSDLGREDLARAFVHSLVPIAAVYAVAHYLTLLVFEGQAIAYLASDPLGRGWDLLGTADATIDFGVLSQNLTWYLQVGAVVAGHVAALVLAHDRALALLPDARRAARSQYWMLSVMVGFTTLALWLLAQAGT